MIGDTYKGLRVLDLGTNIAAPYSAMILADMGADVIKIERYPAGDDTRALPPKADDVSAVFWTMNRNKRSLVLDLKSEVGRDALLRMAEQADVLIESFPPGFAREKGLSYPDFAARNARLVHCTISAFGEGQIGGRLPGYDALVQAVSGMMSLTGHPEDEPVRIGPSVIDIGTGMWAAMGIMAALARRESTGRGEHVASALLDTAITLMNHQLTGIQASGQAPGKLGSGAPSAVPYRVFQASDHPLMIATASDAQFKRLCDVLGLKSLSENPALARMAGRIDHRAEIDREIALMIGRRGREEWLDILMAAGISCGRVNDLAGACAEPVVIEREMMVETAGGGLPLLRLPIDPGGDAARRAPPRLGEHSREVLEEYGFADEDLERLV